MGKRKTDKKKMPSSSSTSSRSKKNARKCSSSSESHSSAACAVKKVTVCSQPTISVNQQVNTQAVFPVEILVGAPQCPDKCGQDYKPKNICAKYETNVKVPISFKIKCDLRPSTKVPVNVVAKTPHCASKKCK